MSNRPNRTRTKVADPRRYDPPHPLLCPCQWCQGERDAMLNLKMGRKHWVPGTLSPLEAENKRRGMTIDDEISELF